MGDMSVYIDEKKVAEASFEIKTLITLIKNSTSLANLKIVPSLCSFEKTILETISLYSDFVQKITEFDAKFQERLSDRLKEPDFANKYYTFFNELDKANLTEEQLAAFSFEIAGYGNLVLENELRTLISRKENGENLSKIEYDRIEFLEQQIKVNDLEQQLFYTYDKNNPDYIVLYDKYTNEKQELIKITYKPIHEELALKQTELIGLTGEEREQLLYEIYELEMSCKEEEIQLKTLELKPDLSLTYDTSKIPSDHEYWKIYGNESHISGSYSYSGVTYNVNQTVMKHINVEEYNKEKKKELAILQQEYADLGIKVSQNKKNMCEKIINSPYYKEEQKIVYQNLYNNMDLIIKDYNNIKEKAILEEKKQNYDSKSYDYKVLTEQQLDLDIKFITENFYNGVPEREYMEKVETLEWQKENITDYIEMQVNATTNSCFDNFSYIEHEYIQELLDIKEFNEMNAWDKTGERAATFLNSFAAGAGNVLEQYYDGAIMLGGGLAGLVNSDISARAGYYVKRDLSGEAYDDSVKYLNQGIAYGAWHEVGDFAGSLITESAVITAYALASAYCPALNGIGGATLSFGVKGMGKGSEKALNSGASFGEAYWAGVATGAVETANAYMMYSPKGFTPTAGQKIWVAGAKDYVSEGITCVYDHNYDMLGATKNATLSMSATALSEFKFKKLFTNKTATVMKEKEMMDVNGKPIYEYGKVKTETYEATEIVRGKTTLQKARGNVKNDVNNSADAYEQAKAAAKEKAKNVKKDYVDDASNMMGFMNDATKQNTDATKEAVEKLASKSDYVIYTVDRVVQKGVKDLTKDGIEYGLDILGSNIK